MIRTALTPIGEIKPFEIGTKTRPFRALYRTFRNSLVLRKCHEGHADILRLLRDAAFNVRTGPIRSAAARLTGEHLVRAHRWAMTQPTPGRLRTAATRAILMRVCKTTHEDPPRL